MSYDDGKLLASDATGKVLRHPSTGKLLYGIRKGFPTDVYPYFPENVTVTLSDTGTLDLDGTYRLAWHYQNSDYRSWRFYYETPDHPIPDPDHVHYTILLSRWYQEWPAWPGLNIRWAVFIERQNGPPPYPPDSWYVSRGAATPYEDYTIYGTYDVHPTIPVVPPDIPGVTAVVSE